MSVTGWFGWLYVLVTFSASLFLLFGFGVVAAMEILGKRSEKQIGDSIDQATEFRSDFD